MSALVHKPGTAPTIGLWDHPLEDPNIEDAPIVHALDRFAAMPVFSRAEAAYRARFRMKSWQYMTAVSDELFIAFVVGTAGFASNGFVYAVETSDATIHQKFAITPFKVGTTLSPTSTRGAHRFSTSGLAVSIENQDAGRRFSTRVDATTLSGPKLAAELSFTSAPADEHFSMCVPLPGGRWNYTHKFAAFGVEGSVVIGTKTFRFTPDRAYGTLDFTKMYALRHAVWKWIALCGRTKQGKLLSLNLVDPAPAADVSENMLWIDGKREALAGIEIVADTTRPDSGWTVVGDTLDTKMTHIAHVEQHLDMPLVKHTLRHIVGSFSGRVRTKSGHIHDFERIVGIAEDFDNLW